MPPLSIRSLAPAPTREQILRRCAQLRAQRNDLDPDGPAYKAASVQLDSALGALFELGPKDPWVGEPA